MKPIEGHRGRSGEDARKNDPEKLPRLGPSLGGQGPSQEGERQAENRVLKFDHAERKPDVPAQPRGAARVRNPLGAFGSIRRRRIGARRRVGGVPRLRFEGIGVGRRIR